jgi:hypothetical protein
VAEAIRTCLENNGPYQVFRNPNGVYYFHCQLPDGRWGTLIAEKVKDLYYERSSYIKDPGTWEKLQAWMRRWNATRWNGGP